MDVECFTGIIEKCFPRIRVERARQILGGCDSFVFEINDELIFRFPKTPLNEPQFRTEWLLLPSLANALSLPIPRIKFFWEGSSLYEKPFSGYDKLHGQPLNEIDLKSCGAGFARDLGRFLTELHRFPLERASELGVLFAGKTSWRNENQALYERVKRQVYPLLEDGIRRMVSRLFDAFFGDEANFRWQAVLTHADLGAEHILCDPERAVISGIIDWGEVAVGDPALDFAGLYYDIGPEFTRAVLSNYDCDVDASFRNRMIFYSRLIPLHEMLYGIESGDEEWLTKGRRQLDGLQR